MNSSKTSLIAASSVWVAVLLNLLPGLGTGYIYQRRWKPYWITIIITFFWLLIGFYSVQSIDPADPVTTENDQTGFYGLVLISIATAIESGLAVKSAREQSYLTTRDN